MKRFHALLSILVVILLAACGGGGGSAGSSATSSTVGTTTTATASTSTTATLASDLIVGFDKTSLSNTGSDRVNLSITAINADGNVVPSVPVSVALDNGGVFNGASSADSNGQFTGVITSPGNKSNRAINVTITSGSVRKTAVIDVVGSQIAVTPVPGAPVAGQAVTLNIRLTDAVGNGIGSSRLNISGSAGFSGAVDTDSNGNAIFNGTAPASTGTYSVLVNGSGITATNALTVISATGGGIPNAVGPVGPASLNGSPNNIPNNLTSATNNRAVLTFKIKNASNVGVENVRVKFLISAPGLGAGERMSTGDTVVYTNSAGEVTSDYIPGTRSSPNNGVSIRACYGLDDASVATCATFVDSSLTVTGQALNVSIFNNNTLVGKYNNTIYVQTLVLQVADSANQPVKDAIISSSVDVTHYGKGGAWAANYNYPSSGIAPTKADDYTNTLSDTLQPTSSLATGTVTGFNVWCTSEDLNRNGTRDVGDDLDGDSVLEPRSSDVTVSAPAGNKTDSSGQMLLEVQWGQNVGGWLAYTVKVSTNVEGSEGTNSRAFTTGVLQGDVANGAFLTPPYGVNNCRTNN